MMLQVEISDSIARQAQALAEREHTTLDALIASSLIATLDHAPQRMTVAERAARAATGENRALVEAILARVPDVPPLPGDELPDA